MKPETRRRTAAHQLAYQLARELVREGLMASMAPGGPREHDVLEVIEPYFERAMELRGITRRELESEVRAAERRLALRIKEVAEEALK